MSSAGQPDGDDRASRGKRRSAEDNRASRSERRCIADRYAAVERDEESQAGIQQGFCSSGRRKPIR